MYRERSPPRYSSDSRHAPPSARGYDEHGAPSSRGRGLLDPPPARPPYELKLFFIKRKIIYDFTTGILTSAMPGAHATAARPVVAPMRTGLCMDVCD